MSKQTIAETGRELTPVEIRGTAEAREEFRRAESLERMWAGKHPIVLPTKAQLATMTSHSSLALAHGHVLCTMYQIESTCKRTKNRSRLAVIERPIHDYLLEIIQYLITLNAGISFSRSPDLGSGCRAQELAEEPEHWREVTHAMWTLVNFRPDYTYQQHLPHLQVLSSYFAADYMAYDKERGRTLPPGMFATWFAASIYAATPHVMSMMMNVGVPLSRTPTKTIISWKADQYPWSDLHHGDFIPFMWTRREQILNVEPGDLCGYFRAVNAFEQMQDEEVEAIEQVSSRLRAYLTAAEVLGAVQDKVRITNPASTSAERNQGPT